MSNSENSVLKAKNEFIFYLRPTEKVFVKEKLVVGESYGGYVLNEQMSSGKHRILENNLSSFFELKLDDGSYYSLDMIDVEQTFKMYNGMSKKFVDDLGMFDGIVCRNKKECLGISRLMFKENQRSMGEYFWNLYGENACFVPYEGKVLPVDHFLSRAVCNGRGTQPAYLFLI